MGPVLEQAAHDLGIEGKINYLNMIDFQTDVALQEFRDEYGIKFVPALLEFQSGKIVRTFDKDRTVGNLISFLQQNVAN